MTICFDIKGRRASVGGLLLLKSYNECMIYDCCCLNKRLIPVNIYKCGQFVIP